MSQQPLTFGSLFAGIGGLDLGLERAGMRCVWQVEKDAYCRAVLAKHWPDVTRYEDVKDVGGSNLAPVDLICGGFPCQDVSAAGKQVGIHGDRSGLWFEYARIIRELRPTYVIVENVAALLDGGLGVVLGSLADIGYDAEWSCVPACAVGAPHTRDRVFVLAYSGPVRRNAGWTEQPLRRAGLDGEARPVARWPHGHWSAEPGMARVVDGIPPRLVRDPVGALGNAVVPQVAEVIGRLIVQADAEQRGAA